MRYCVYGSSSDHIHPEYLEGGRVLGRCLAEHGHGMVFGGGNHGMMGVAARGITEVRREMAQRQYGLDELPLTEGPEILGISPRFFNEEGILYSGCTEMIYTETMRERKQLMEEKADGFIITPGGLGTLDEFFEIATLRQLGQHGKPVAILNLRGYFDAMEDMLKKAVEENFVVTDTLDAFHFFREPEELVSWIEKQEISFMDWKTQKYKKEFSKDE